MAPDTPRAPASVTAVCPICRCAETRLFHVRDGRPLLICHDCRHIFWERMPTLEEVAAYYASVYSGFAGQHDIQEAHRAYYRGHAQELAGLAGVPIERMIIADVGCSFPTFAEEAMCAGAALAFGVDWSEDARTDGIQRRVAVLTPDDFAALIPDGFVDVLRYSHTLEHLIDPVAVLRAQVAKVRPGGLVYITQPNFPVLRWAESPIEPHDSDFPIHLHYFNPLSVRRLAEAAGLSTQRYFSVTDPERGQERYGALIDVDHVRARLADWAEKGEAPRGALNNFPVYAGLDGTAHLRVAPPPPPPPPPTPPGLRARVRAVFDPPPPAVPPPLPDSRGDLLAVIGILQRRARGGVDPVPPAPAEPAPSATDTAADGQG